MGYTHYFEQSRNLNEEEILFIEKIINTSEVKITGWNGEENCKIILTVDEVNFNGVDDESHENFCLNNRGWAFCKTQRKSYDEVVVAVLIYLAESKALTWSSDGSDEHGEFDDAKELLNKTKNGDKKQ